MLSCTSQRYLYVAQENTVQKYKAENKNELESTIRLHGAADDIVTCLCVTPKDHHLFVAKTNCKIEWYVNGQFKCIVGADSSTERRGIFPSSSQQHSYTISAMCVDDQKKILYSASYDGTIRQWSLVKNTCIQTHRAGTMIHEMCLSPNGEWIVVVAGNTIQKWPTKMPEKKSDIRHFFLYSGSLLVNKPADPISITNPYRVMYLSVTPDNQYVYGYTPSQSRVDVWTLSTLQLVKWFLLSHDANPACFSPDGLSLYVMNENVLQQWSMETEKKEREWQHTEDVNEMYMTQKGDVLFLQSELGPFYYSVDYSVD